MPESDIPAKNGPPSGKFEMPESGEQIDRVAENASTEAPAETDEAEDTQILSPASIQAPAPPPIDTEAQSEAQEEPQPDEAGPSPLPSLSQTTEPPEHAPRFRLPSLAVGALLIALGIIYMWPALSGGYILVPGVILAIAALGIALSLLAHWLYSGRRARGTLFLALIGLLWGLLTGVYFLDPGSAHIGETWPLYLTALGFAVLLTFLGDRRRDRRLITPGLVLTVAGLAALLITTGQLPGDWLTLARQGWPWVVAVLVLGLLPLAIRRVPRGE